jgi:hypothetical protein
VIVHALSSEDAFRDFFDVCNLLYKFLSKPTVAAQYKGPTLKRLLEQRWAGNLDTVSVILKSHTTLVEFLVDIRKPRINAEVKMEASGLFESITEPSFLFLANVTHKVLGLMEPPNRMLQAERTDLLTAVQLINSASDCLRLLRSEEEFKKIWNETGSECDAPPPQRQPPKALQPEAEWPSGRSGDFPVGRPANEVRWTGPQLCSGLRSQLDRPTVVSGREASASQP